MCQEQYYDEATNMKKAAAEIKSIASQALYLPCYGYSINLAVPDTKSYQDGASLLRFENGLLLQPTGSVECTRHLASGRVHNTSSILTMEMEAFRVHPT